MAFLFYFDDMAFVMINGSIVDKSKAGLSPDDHSYRYGDGVFETMKIANRNILLEKYHFERLFSGLKTLKFKIPAHFTRQKINRKKWRGSGFLYQEEAAVYMIVIISFPG